MTAVYIVTCGEYSAYHIDAVFADKATAERFAAGFAGNVEEWELDQSNLAEWRACHVCKINLKSGKLHPFQRLSKEFLSPRDVGTSRRHDWDGCIYAYSPISQAHAQKLAIEARQKDLREKHGTKKGK